MLEERRAKAHLKTLHYQRAVVRLYNRREKLTSRWEGPYRVVRDDTYTLSIMEGKTLPRTWHVSNLKKFYVYDYIVLTRCLRKFRESETFRKEVTSFDKGEKLQKWSGKIVRNKALTPNTQSK
ncbi:hypothetical protein B296_00039140 [Ensete ventricosum]|uniref:Uncharacterized protein n=1 Tax=Ensete ventricosum TaxID=4639 RepID=A0A426Z0Z8_ENSVE|nr:hypothetical protein B296_00039140 [Ensete ventricosum]